VTTKNEHDSESEKAVRRPSVRRSVSFFLLPWFFGLWLAFVGWQYLEHRAASRAHREGLEEAGRAGIGMLEAAIRSMGRGRRGRPEFLSLVLDEVVAVPMVKGAWLTETDGTVLASTGAAEGKPAPLGVSRPLWLEDGVVVGRKIDTGPCAGPEQGRGPRGGRPGFSAEEKPAHLFLFLDRTHCDRETAADRKLRVILISVFLVGLLAVYLFVAARLKARHLVAELAVSRERARRHREWALLGAGLAHETKNPLSAVRGIAQRLAEMSKEECPQAKEAALIVDEVDRVVGRIDEFLEFARPVEPRPEPVDLEEVFEEMRKLVAADFEPHGARVLVEAERVSVYADRGMLRQILLNLLVNASKAVSPGGTVTLRSRREAGGTVAVDVADDGRGISPEEIEKIFEPYYTRTPGGTGLGLAIVRRLVELHGWKIEVKSSPEAGTRVRIGSMRPVK